MSKPIAPLNAFAPLSPPWSLTQLDANFTTISAAINDLGTYNIVIPDTGTVNAMVATVPAGLTFALVSGVSLYVQVANVNTSNTVTLNVNGTGAKSVVDTNGNLPSKAALEGGAIYQFIYDGTNWRCMNFSTYVMQTATKLVTTTRTGVGPTADPELQIAISGTGSYEFFCHAYTWASSAPQGLSWQIVYAGLFDQSISYQWTYSTNAAITGLIPVSNSSAFGIGTNVGQTPYSEIIWTRGNLVALGAGQISLAWNSGTAGNSNVGKASFLRVARIG